MVDVIRPSDLTPVNDNYDTSSDELDLSSSSCSRSARLARASSFDYSQVDLPDPSELSNQTTTPAPVSRPDFNDLPSTLIPGFPSGHDSSEDELEDGLSLPVPHDLYNRLHDRSLSDSSESNAPSPRSSRSASIASTASDASEASDAAAPDYDDPIEGEDTYSTIGEDEIRRLDPEPPVDPEEARRIEGLEMQGKFIKAQRDRQIAEFRQGIAKKEVGHRVGSLALSAGLTAVAIPVTIFSAGMASPLLVIAVGNLGLAIIDTSCASYDAVSRSRGNDGLVLHGDSLGAIINKILTKLNIKDEHTRLKYADRISAAIRIALGGFTMLADGEKPDMVKLMKDERLTPLQKDIVERLLRNRNFELDEQEEIEAEPDGPTHDELLRQNLRLQQAQMDAENGNDAEPDDVDLEPRLPGESLDDWHNRLLQVPVDGEGNLESDSENEGDDWDDISAPPRVEEVQSSDEDDEMHQRLRNLRS
ncbi:hypothetical protein [Parashewanella tropica]|uniref:hypothetical protein n=1 Tax=Parashewanella tropica TaxID=2547970 RepID=UPI00105A9E25|nr:hypothetical protein [Parashewanella tropica]